MGFSWRRLCIRPRKIVFQTSLMINPFGVSVGKHFIHLSRNDFITVVMWTVFLWIFSLMRKLASLKTVKVWVEMFFYKNYFVVINIFFFVSRGSSVSSTEKDIDTWLTKAWTAIDRLSIIWKSNLIDKMKRSFFKAAVVSILLYGCTTLTLTKRLEKKLDGNYTRMLRAILNRSWQQHSTRYQLYGHLPPITKTIQARRTRHTGHYWRSKDEIVSDVLLWTPAYGQSKAGRPARTFIQQLCDDTGCNPEDLPEAMKYRETWREGSGISVLVARHDDDDDFVSIVI